MCDKYRKKLMFYSFKKIKESGDEVKIKYVKNLIRYFSIFTNLNFILKRSSVLTEEKYYYCETFYHFLDNFIDTSKRNISEIIVCIAFDLPLGTFYKYIMRPDIYEEEFEKEQYENDQQECEYVN